MAIIKLNTRSLSDDSVTTPKIADTVNLGRRNMVHNGAMKVSQRGNYDSSSTDSGFFVDRYYSHNFPGSSGCVLTRTHADVTDLAGFNKSFKITVTTEDDGSDTSNVYSIARYQMEGQDCQHLRYGYSDAKTTTLSFWVKCSVVGTYTVQFYHVGALTDGSYFHRYFTQYTIDSANTWEKKTITIPGSTLSGGLITDDEGNGLNIMFSLSATSDRMESSLAKDAWVADSTNPASFRSYTGQTQFTQTLNATWEITGMQFEVGDTATPFEHRSYREDLDDCQRYLQIYDSADGSGGYATLGMWQYSNATRGILSKETFVTPMRSPPSFSFTNGTSHGWRGQTGIAGNSEFDFSSVANAQFSKTGGYAVIDHSSYDTATNITDGTMMRLEADGDSGANIIFSAEI
jgi:hypothetical protein